MQNKEPNKLGFAGMIIGICSIFLSCILIGGFTGLAGFVISIIGLTKKNSKYATSITGLLTSLFSMMSATVALFFFLIFNSPEQTSTESTEVPQQSNIETTESEEIPVESEIVLSNADLFATEMSQSSEFVSFETAKKLYEFLTNELLFEEIDFEQKNSVGDILFDISADNYNLMVSVDNDGIYSIKCGYCELYDGNSVLVTKTGLDDRSTSEYETAYYSIAKEIVKSNLKSPKSADFPSLWSDEIKMQRNKDIVGVQGYVDAENSFGVSIRSQWLVEFRVIDINSYSYETLYISIDGQEAGEFIDLN